MVQARDNTTFGRLAKAHLSAKLRSDITGDTFVLDSGLFDSALGRFECERELARQPSANFRLGVLLRTQECMTRLYPGGVDLTFAARLVPTFRSSCPVAALTFHELQKVIGTSNSMILVPAFYLKFLGRIRHLRCRTSNRRHQEAQTVFRSGACSCPSSFASESISRTFPDTRQRHGVFDGLARRFS
jgi:hypothetical protein